MVRTPWYYIHLPHHRCQISRTTVLLPTAPPSPPTQVSEYKQNQFTSVHPPTQTSPHVTQHTHPTSPPLTSSSGHPHPQTHSPKTKHINSIPYISTIPSLPRYTAMSQTSPAFSHPSPSSQRCTSHLK